MRSFLLATSIAGLLASACSEQPGTKPPEAKTPGLAKESCVQRPRNWRHVDRQFIGAGSGGLVFYEVEIRPDASITFNGEPVDLARAGYLIGLSVQLEPNFPLVLRTTADSHCPTAERIRARMDEATICRRGFCFESRRWDALGLPTFEAHQNRFAEIEKRRP